MSSRQSEPMSIIRVSIVEDNANERQLFADLVNKSAGLRCASVHPRWRRRAVRWPRIGPMWCCWTSDSTGKVLRGRHCRNSRPRCRKPSSLC